MWRAGYGEYGCVGAGSGDAEPRNRVRPDKFGKRRVGMGGCGGHHCHGIRVCEACEHLQRGVDMEREAWPNASAGAVVLFFLGRKLHCDRPRHVQCGACEKLGAGG